VDRPSGWSANPVQFNREAVKNLRAPEAFEHTERVSMEMNLGWDRIADLTNQGAIARGREGWKNKDGI
jgi:hypothetical protein